LTTTNNHKLAKAAVYLRALGLSTEGLDSFTERKRIQKMFYLLKQFGADLPFGYTWYLHGPYSPELTRTLFSDPDQRITNDQQMDKSVLQSVNDLRNFLADDFYSVDALELIVSLVYLIKHGPEEEYDTKQSIVQFLMTKKPQFSREEVDRAWNKIVELGLWKTYISKLKKSHIA
jgi:uncharacterized protein YwgA